MPDLKKGDRLVGFPDNRPSERLFIEVQRVAKDGSWADIVVCTWAVLWRKRQPTPTGLLPHARFRAWGDADLEEQQQDHMAKLLEARRVG